MTMAVRYVFFAVISVLVNFATQEGIMKLAPVHALALSILGGTVTGFAVKYVLDKKWIFLDGYTSHGDEARKVSLYALFSVVTTLVFWTFELAFWTVWQNDIAKYTGAALGLSLGYMAKYALDRRFVFRPERV